MGFFDDVFGGIKDAVNGAVDFGKDILHEGTGLIKFGVGTIGGVVNNGVNAVGNLGGRVVDVGGKFGEQFGGILSNLSNPFLLIAIVIGGVIILPKLLDSRR
jgi:hypothetical protein